MNQTKCCEKCKGQRYNGAWYDCCIRDLDCSCHQTNKEIENSQKDIKSGYLGEEGNDVLVYTTNQTNNRIREEKLNTLKSMLWELGHTNKDAHHVIEYVDELLKSQREELVKKIEKHQNFITTSDYDVGYNDCKENIINLIKNN